MNLEGDIRSSGTALVVTNLLDVATSLGAIGSSANRLAVDLVQFVARARVDGPSADVFRAPRLLVDAHTDAFLSLRGLDRANFSGPVTRSGQTLTRTDGKPWSTNGFAVGDVVKIVGESGTRKVTAVSGGVLTLDGAAFATGPATVSVVRTEITVGVDEIVAGGDVDLELRTGLRQVGTTETGDVTVQVPNEDSIWRDGEVHRFHFRGTNTTAGHDPARTGASGLLDPAVYVGATGTDVPIDSFYRFKLRHVPLARSEVQIPGTSLVMYKAETAGGEYVLFSGTAAAAETPGLVAGRHIDIRDTEGLSSGNDLAVDGVSATTIRIYGFTNLADTGSGWLDVNVEGSVELKEISGDLRVGIVRSRASTVKLTAAAGIRDADTAEDGLASVNDPQDVQGSSIELHALAGSIGTESDFLETNLDDVISSTGMLDADATLGIYLWEVAGDLRIGKVHANQTGTPGTTDAALVSEGGAILDGVDDAGATDVEAIRIDLKAATDIGKVDNDLEIDSSTAGFMSGRLYAEAGNSIYLTENIAELVVLAAKALTGLVRLTIPDTNGSRAPPLDNTGITSDEALQRRNTTPEDLDLIASGQSLVAQNDAKRAAPSTDTTAQTRSGIWAKGDIHLWVGDDLDAPATTEIVAGGTIRIHGDVTRTPGTTAALDTPSADERRTAATARTSTSPAGSAASSTSTARTSRPSSRWSSATSTST